VRIDSGDLLELSRQVRRILDEAGHPEVQILASGDLNEYRIAELLDQGAPIDAFGVGTEMGTSYDAPALGGVYKLVEDESGYRIKRSTGKVTLPGRKQVWRVYRDGVLQEDIITLADEPGPPGAEPLLVEVMAGGVRSVRESLPEARARAQRRLQALPPALRDLRDGSYPLRLGPKLEALFHRMAS
jgi:nicotinate phosphoribosyltransferase